MNIAESYDPEGIVKSNGPVEFEGGKCLKLRVEPLMK